MTHEDPFGLEPRRQRARRHRVAALRGVIAWLGRNLHADTPYAVLEPLAHVLKSLVQMAIGVVTLYALWKDGTNAQHVHDLQFWQIWTTCPDVAVEHLLHGIGVGLAAAAVVELAYTLFTPGPDEALNPLMLSLASAILLIVGGLDHEKITLALAVALLVLGILLALLFMTRLMLSADDREPTIWWVRKRLGLPPIERSR